MCMHMCMHMCACACACACRAVQSGDKGLPKTTTPVAGRRWSAAQPVSSRGPAGVQGSASPHLEPTDVVREVRPSSSAVCGTCRHRAARPLAAVSRTAAARCPCESSAYRGRAADVCRTCPARRPPPRPPPVASSKASEVRCSTADSIRRSVWTSSGPNPTTCSRSGRDAEVARASVPASPLGNSNSRAAVSSGTLGPSSGTLGLSWALSRLERRHCLLPRLWPVEPVPLLHPPRPRRQRGAVRLCRQHLERLARLTSRARDMSRTCPPRGGRRPSGGASGSQPPANW